MTFGEKAPIYVTRKTADGSIGYWSINIWWGVAALMLVVANITLWGIVGIKLAMEALL